MSKICPICNGLRKAYKNCPICGSCLNDEGILKDFFDPYSPYITNQNSIQTTCLHLLSCHNCNYHERAVYNLVTI